MKRGLAAALVAFLVIEGALLHAVVRNGDAGEALIRAFREPFTQMMLVDFSFFAGIVFFWMLGDAKKRGKNGWAWLPGIILAPTAALIAFIFLRDRRSAG